MTLNRINCGFFDDLLLIIPASYLEPEIPLKHPGNAVLIWDTTAEGEQPVSGDG